MRSLGRDGSDWKCTHNFLSSIDSTGQFCFRICFSTLDSPSMKSLSPFLIGGALCFPGFLVSWFPSDTTFQDIDVGEQAGATDDGHYSSVLFW